MSSRPKRLGRAHISPCLLIPHTRFDHVVCWKAVWTWQSSQAKHRAGSHRFAFGFDGKKSGSRSRRCVVCQVSCVSWYSIHGLESPSRVKAKTLSMSIILCCRKMLNLEQFVMLSTQIAIDSAVQAWSRCASGMKVTSQIF
jgi:hypothetical protein